MSCGLPDWTTLSSAIVAVKWKEGLRWQYNIRASLRKGNPLDAMRIARRWHGSNFNAVVRDCLYSNGVKVSETVEAIAELEGVNRICTFNYDDVLEEAFRERNRVYSSVNEDEALDLLGSETLIFHPHGYLPRSRKAEADKGNFSSRIILSEDDYHNLYSIPYAWSNIVQISLLMNYSVLFVGLSLRDPNTRRLLDVCKRMQTTHMHYALLKDPSYNPEDTGMESLNYAGLDVLEEQCFEDRKILPIWFKDFSEIPSILRAIEKLA